METEEESGSKALTLLAYTKTGSIYNICMLVLTS